jgi:glycosyltransferase involved in cell wall biosynthesis
MRIALLFLGRRGGGLMYSYCAAQALTSRCELMVVVSSQSEHGSRWNRIAARQLVCVDTFGSISELVRRGLCLNSITRAVREIRTFQPDAIYVPMGSPLTPLICSWFPSIPKVITLHDPVLHPGDRSVLKRLYRHLTLSQADRVVVLSRAFADTLLQAGVSPSQIDVIPHGEFSYYRQGSTSPSRHERRGRTLLFFGRLEQYKGIDVLMKAFASVKAEVPDARLKIVGSGDFSKYEVAARRSPDTEVVNRWIADEEVAAHFEEAYALVLPYTSASQSGVIAIAASLGVPAIASNVGGLGEQISDGVSGLMVPPGDPDALAQTCISLLRDPALRERLGRGAKRAAEHEMNWTQISEMIEASCRKAISDKETQAVEGSCPGPVPER